MDTDFRKTYLKVTSDPRLRAGLRGALECICERHGLSKAEQHELAAAVERECGQELHDTGQCGCTVTINESEDRVEVRVAPASSANGSKRDSAETNVTGGRDAEGNPHGESGSQSKANGGSCAIFVKHFRRNPAHS